MKYWPVMMITRTKTVLEGDYVFDKFNLIQVSKYLTSAHSCPGLGTLLLWGWGRGGVGGVCVCGGGGSGRRRKENH